ncbi:MAG: hypothetical protein ACXVI8_07745 [Halobacteriota archaeon]
MKRMTWIAAALCLIMLTTIGVGVVAAKQEANPRQAGASSVYFVDVAATDAHGSGKLMINVKEHKFVFTGKGFEPCTKYWLRSEASGTQTLGFAVANPAGSLNFQGAWPRSINSPAAPALRLSSTDMTASFTTTFKSYSVQNYAIWTIDASSSTGPIYRYELNCYYKDTAGNDGHGFSGAYDPSFAVQLNNINYRTPVLATLTVYDASGNHVTSPDYALPWS